MPEFDLGTAKGYIVIDSSGAVRGIGTAKHELDDFSSRNQRMAQVLTHTGLAMTGIGAAAVAGFALAINASANFEKKISAIGAVSGESGKVLDEVRKKALQLGKDTVFSAGEAADAMEELVKAGLTVDQVLHGAADATVSLAAAGEINIKDAATIAANAMNAFALSAADMPKVADLIAGAANASAIDVAEFGLSLQQSGAVAHLAGLSFNDLAVAIAEMGNAGIKGSDAGTSLKTFLQNLVPQTKKQVELMKALGIITVGAGVSEADYAKAQKGHLAASDALTKAEQRLAELRARQAASPPKTELQRISQAQQLEHATTAVAAAQTKLTGINNVLASSVGKSSNAFFDAEGKTKKLSEISQVLQNALKGMSKEQQLATLQTLFGSDSIRAAAILAENGAEGFDKLAASMGKVTAADVAKKRMDNLKGSLEQLRGSIETAFISTGSQFQGIARKIVDALTGLVNAFIKLSPATQKWIIIGVLGIGMLVGLAGAFIATIGFALKFVEAFRALKDAFQFLKGLKAVTSAMEALNASFLANPVVLIVAGLIALGVALVILYKKSKTFRDIVDAIGRAFKAVGLAIFDFVRGAIEFLKKNWDLLLPILLGPIGAAILIWHRFHDEIISIVTTVVGAIVGFFEALPGRIVGAISAMIDAIINFFAKLPERVGFVIGFIIGLWLSLPARIEAVIETIANAVREWVINLVESAARIGVDVIEAIVNFFIALPGRIAGAVVAAAQAFAGFVVGLAQAAARIGPEVVGAIIRFFEALPGRVIGFLQTIVSGAAGFVTSMVNDALDMGRRFFDNVVSGIQGLPGKVADILGEVIKAFLSIVKKGFDAAKNFAGGLWNGFKKGLGISSPSFIEKAMFAMNDNVAKSVLELRKQVGSIQGIGANLPTISTTLSVARGSGILPAASSGSGGSSSAAAVGADSFEVVVPTTVVMPNGDVLATTTSRGFVNRKRARGRGKG